jgi:cell division protein FtsL
MEVFFVYGLVVLFFVLLIPVIYLLMKDPIQNTELEQEQALTPMAQVAKMSSSEKISYGILAALFTLMLALTVMVQRTKS